MRKTHNTSKFKMAAPRGDQHDVEDKHQTSTRGTIENIQADHKSSKHLLYSEKFPENLLSDRLNVLTAKGRPPDFKKPQTFRVPNSSVLGQVKNFLPQMEAANESLNKLVETVPRNQLDIENVDGCSGPIIEMNLALVETNDCSDEDFTDNSSDSDTEDAESVQYEQIHPKVTMDTIKLNSNIPKRKPHIIEINKGSSDSLDTSHVIER